MHLFNKKLLHYGKRNTFIHNHFVLWKINIVSKSKVYKYILRNKLYKFRILNSVLYIIYS